MRAIQFPLRFRGRRPGDRFRAPGGTKSIKKLMIEYRIPRGERSCLPVLEDGQGRVLWIGGIGPASDLALEVGDLVIDLVMND